MCGRYVGGDGRYYEVWELIGGIMRCGRYIRGMWEVYERYVGVV